MASFQAQLRAKLRYPSKAAKDVMAENLHNDNVNPSNDTEPALIPAFIAKNISSAPKEVILKFLDLIGNGIGTVYSPLGKILDARASRYEQEQKLIVDEKQLKRSLKRMEFAKKLADSAESRIASSLLGPDIDNMSATDRKKYFEDLISSEEFKSILKVGIEQQRRRAQVLIQAAQMLPSEADPMDIPKDWSNAFFKYVEIIDDKEMQSLWARILSEKIKRSDSTSKKTLRALQDITWEEAEIFQRFCSIVIEVDNRALSIRLDKYESTDKYLSYASMNFDDLLRLAEYDLVMVSSREFQCENGSVLDYYGNKFAATRTFRCLANPLTVVGSELYRIATRKPVEGYLNAVLKVLGDNVAPLDSGSGKATS